MFSVGVIMLFMHFHLHQIPYDSQSFSVGPFEGLLGHHRTALPKVQKYQMVITQTKPQDEANSLKKPKANMGFLFLWGCWEDSRTL